jgi:hypothetical protein
VETSAFPIILISRARVRRNRSFRRSFTLPLALVFAGLVAKVLSKYPFQLYMSAITLIRYRTSCSQDANAS